jgi:hypothetical protein
MGHRPSTRRTVSEMLYDDFEPYKEVDGELVSVYVSEDDSSMVMNLTFGSITFQTDPNDGTLYWRDGPRSEIGIDISFSSPWMGHVGHTFDHAWLTMNRRGYIDGALLSFGNMRPSVALSVVASAIKVATIGHWTALSQV